MTSNLFLTFLANFREENLKLLNLFKEIYVSQQGLQGNIDMPEVAFKLVSSGASSSLTI